MEAGDIAQKLQRLILKWAKLVWIWIQRFAKIRIERLRLGRSQENLDRRMSRLGAEFYSLYRQGETEFLKSLVVLQQLKIVEEAESRNLAIHGRIETIENEYRMKKEVITGVDQK